MLEKLIRDIKIKRPFGIFLSGGLDSGILAALLQPDFAITCNFEGDYYDELEYAKITAEYLKIPLTIIRPDGDDFKEVMEKGLKILGKPVQSVSLYPWYKIMEKVKGQRMVNGEGSDETFGGYTRFIILQKIQEMYEMESLKGYYLMLNSIFGSIAQVHSKLCGVNPEKLVNRYQEKIGLINQLGWAEFTESLPPLIDLERKFAKHFDIDLYQPFMNKEIQEYGWSLSDSEKIQGEKRKIKVLEIAEKYLPEKVWQRRDKKGFVSPCNEWCGSLNKYDKTNYLKFQNEIVANLADL